MSDTHFKVGKEHRLTISVPAPNDPVLIVCPVCAGKATVVLEGEDTVKASCFKCGFSASKQSSSRSLAWHDDNPTDGYFGYELWLKTDCSGHTLWAFNIRHLNFLESYVSATLRERSQDSKWGWSNSSLASRLPKWIKAGNKRDIVLKAISLLKERV